MLRRIVRLDSQRPGVLFRDRRVDEKRDEKHRKPSSIWAGTWPAILAKERVELTKKEAY